MSDAETADYLIKVSGCDDSTSVVLPLTPAEAEAVHKIAEVVTAASEYVCQPRMSVVPAAQAATEDLPDHDDEAAGDAP